MPPKIKWLCRDPYWNGETGQDASGNDKAKDLSCRQNFHMLVTDGYWNEGDPTLPTTFYDAQTSHPILPANAVGVSEMPAGIKFDTSDPPSEIFWNVAGTKYQSSLANIAFHYWITGLETGLADNVVPYIPNKTTGVTGSVNLTAGDDPLANDEIFWNPASDPATWQHVVQFMVTLGIAGNLNFPSQYNDLRTGKAQ